MDTAFFIRIDSNSILFGDMIDILSVLRRGTEKERLEFLACYFGSRDPDCCTFAVTKTQFVRCIEYLRHMAFLSQQKNARTRGETIKFLSPDTIRRSAGDVWNALALSENGTAVSSVHTTSKDLYQYIGWIGSVVLPFGLPHCEPPSSFSGPALEILTDTCYTSKSEAEEEVLLQFARIVKVTQRKGRYLGKEYVLSILVSQGDGTKWTVSNERCTSKC